MLDRRQARATLPLSGPYVTIMHQPAMVTVNSWSNICSQMYNMHIQ